MSGVHKLLILNGQNWDILMGKELNAVNAVLQEKIRHNPSNIVLYKKTHFYVNSYILKTTDSLFSVQMNQSRAK